MSPTSYFRSAQCLAQLLVVWALLRVIGAHRTGKMLLSKTVIAGETDSTALALWRERGNRLRSVARFLPGANCLARALTLSWWARRKGYAVRVQIGVKPTPRGVEAHAWSMLGDQILDERADVVEQFTHVPFPGASAARAYQ